MVEGLGVQWFFLVESLSLVSGRDRHRGPRLPVEHLVKRQTSETADFFGLPDRGTQACVGSLVARQWPEPSAPSLSSVNLTPRVSSVRQITRHDRRSPKGVRNLNSSGMVWALTPAIFAPPFETSTKIQGRSRCRPTS
jgi:hypothetical protein